LAGRGAYAGNYAGASAGAGAGAGAGSGSEKEEGFAGAGGRVSYAELLKRPEVGWKSLAEAFGPWDEVSAYARTQAEIQIKYEGYIAKQEKQIEKFRKLEHRPIPEGIDYFSLNGLRNEAKEKLHTLRPASVGEAGRISGVSPADVGVLLVHIERLGREKNKEDAI
jgi:tRNA uridine 5-carboxymethylaminomethyl modification enzyme